MTVWVSCGIAESHGRAASKRVDVGGTDAVDRMTVRPAFFSIGGLPRAEGAQGDETVRRTRSGCAFGSRSAGMATLEFSDKHRLEAVSAKRDRFRPGTSVPGR